MAGSLLLLASPSSEAALTTTTLVKNTGQAEDWTGTLPLETSHTLYAQLFTTGSSPEGYRLTSITMSATFGTGQGIANAYLREVDSSSPPLPESTNVLTFTRDPDSPGVFTAPNNSTADLEPNTTYALVVDPGGSANAFGSTATNSDDEDAGAASGWSIANGLYAYNSDGGGSWITNYLYSFHIDVKGAAFNNDPEFNVDAASVTLNVDENTSGLADIATVGAMDDDGDTLSYSSSGADPFTVVSSSGLIRLKAGETLDHEDTARYSFTMRVTDSLDANRDADSSTDDTITVIINVTDLDEDGALTLAPSPIKAATAVTATLTDDDEPTNITWKWETGEVGADNSVTYTEISGATTASYTPTAADIGNLLRVTVTYDDNFTDATDDTDIKTIRLTSTEVQPGNQEPEFASTTATRTATEHFGGANIGAPVAATDGDSDTLVYELAGADAAAFQIDSATGQLKRRYTLDYENPVDVGDTANNNTYVVIVKVKDNKDILGASDDDGDTADDSDIDDTITVTITVTNIAEGGVVTLTGAQRGGTEMTASLTDPDGSISNLTWRWARADTADADPSEFTNISGATSNKYTPVAADVGKYLKVTASYNDGFATGTKTTAEKKTGQIAAGNSEPEFSVADGATVTSTVPENSAAGTNVGSPASVTDSDLDDMGDPRDTLRFTLTGTDASSFTIDAGTGQVKTKAGVTYNFEGSKKTYAVVVNVSDNKDAAGDTNSFAVDDSYNLTINLTNVNEAPVIATAPAAKNVNENQTAVHTFSASDVDASDTQTWTVESSDDGSKFRISSSGVLTFASAPDFEDPKQSGSTDNAYVVTVKVTDAGNDGSALNDTHTMTVNVRNVNEAPVITTDGTDFTAPDVDENTPAATAVATYVATDVDANTTFTWSLEGEDANDFNITRNSDGHGVLTFKSVPDYENPTDDDDNDGNAADNTYDITVKVVDNHTPQGSDTLDVSVTVNDLNETPVVTADHTGADGGATPKFAEIEFDVEDSDLAAADYLVPMAEYSAYDDDGDSVTWDVSGTDADHFTISSDGVLSFKARNDSDNRLNFENPDDDGSNNTYEIVIEADDGQGETDAATHSVGTFAVTVTVTNVNETPEIPLGVDDQTYAEIEYDDNAWTTTVHAWFPRDEETAPGDLTWSLAGTDAASFKLERLDINGLGLLTFHHTSPDRPDFEEPEDRDNSATTEDESGDNVYEIILRISDGTNTREYPLTVTVTDVNERPDITEDFDPPRTYAEIEYDTDTTVSGALPDVHTFTAVDYDDGDTFTWSLCTAAGCGVDHGDFEINASTGVLTFKQNDGLDVGPLPNFEHPQDTTAGGSNTYRLTVVATDNDATPKKTEYDVVVTVTNVNEQPSIDPDYYGGIFFDFTLSESDANEPWEQNNVAFYRAHDEEGGVTWSLTGTDASDFEISPAEGASDGELVFRHREDFENPRDADSDNVYHFNIVATDTQSGSVRRSATRAITLTVTDEEEAGTVAIQAGDESPGVDDTVTFTVSDPDGFPDDMSIDYVIQRGSGGTFTQAQSGTIRGRDSYTYTVKEEDTGKQLRMVVEYDDRRSVDLSEDEKTATSATTDAVTADPRANVPPRLRETAMFVNEGPADIDIGSIVATDRDGDRITYALLEVDDYEYFALSSSGRLRAIQDLDFEDRTTLTIMVTLSDGKGLDAGGNVITDTSADLTGTIRVVVRDVEEPGAVTFSPEEPETGEEQTATLTDGDGGISGQNWTWERSESRNGPWTFIAGETSDSYTPIPDDEGFYFRVTVTYTDRRSAGKAVETISGPVPSENRRPTFPATETGERTVAENTRSGQNIGEPVAAEDPENNRLTYSLSGDDAASFSVVSSTGQLRTQAALDYETKSAYRVTVNVHDGLDGAGDASTIVDDSQDVTITVTNVDEAGEVTLDSATGLIQARVEITATLEDGDDPTALTWQWSRSPNGRTDWVNIAGATLETYLAQDEDEGNFIRAVASYNDGHGQNKTAQQVSPRVGEPPPVNSAPVFPASETRTRSVAEDASGGDSFGDPVAATDLNEGDSAVNDPLEYSLGGTDAALFTIDASTGQLSLAADTTLDFETKRTYRITVSVHDGHNELGDDDGGAIDTTIPVTVEVTDVNEAPEVSGDVAVSFEEESDGAVATYQATDPERDALTWSLTGADASSFWVSSSGRLHFMAPPSYEASPGVPYNVTVQAEDEGGLTGSLAVTVTVFDVEEEGTISIEPPRGWTGTQFSATLSDGDGGVGGEAWQWARSSNRSTWNDISGATGERYDAVADDAGQYLRVTATYSDRRGSNKEASAVLTARVGETRPATNNPPEFPDTATTRSVGQGTAAGRNIGAPVAATDIDADDILTYTLDGTDADSFDIDPATGQLKTRAVLDPAEKDTYSVSVSVHDGFDATYIPSTTQDDTIEVTITVTARTVTPFILIPGLGGPTGPEPSDVEFEWNVTRDIEALADGHGNPTGLWSDDATLWLLQNGEGADDAVYAYDPVTGERTEELEFDLADTNRAPRGVWSDRETAWISDSGQDRLFAYDLETGERVEERDIVLARRNRDARGIWSDGETMWVLNRNPSLFAYDLETGALLGEYELTEGNSDPRGIWSDGVTVWVSDHSAKRLFAYRLPEAPGQPAIEDAEATALERVSGEEFEEPGRVGNNSPRGIWSDGVVMYVADENDNKVYSYNMPDAINARLATLELGAVDFGEFSPLRYEYASETIPHGNIATLTAVPAQESAAVKIEPPDQDGDPENGHQLRLLTGLEITITVTSPDGSRERVYRLLLGDEATAGPSASCLRGAVSVGFSLVVSEGGSVEDLVACAEGRHITALYVLQDGAWTSYIAGAPDFVNDRFRALFADGVAALLPLVVRSEGPATPAPAAPVVTEPFATCLRGEVADGFSLVVYEGGSIEDLDSCAGSRNMTAVYVLDSGEWVSYILGAPEFVNQPFARLFAGGLPAGTPLVVKGEELSATSSH